MLKKILLILLLGTNPFMLKAASDCTCNIEYNEWSTTGKIIFWGTAGTVAVAATPFALPASAVAAITAGAAATKAAVVAVAAQVAPIVIPTTTVGKIGAGLTAVQYARPFILETTEENLKKLQTEKERKQWAAREDFVACLKQNKFGSPRNAAGRPAACEDLALAYAFATSIHNLNRRTQAFKEGKCFCELYT